MPDSDSETIYVLGAGAVGIALAANLAARGRNVIAVRTSGPDREETEVTLRVTSPEAEAPGETGGAGESAPASLIVPVRSVSLSRLNNLSGLAAVTAKSIANPAIAAALREKGFTGSVVLLQNGLGVERAFAAAGFTEIYRAVLYLTGEKTADHAVRFRSLGSCPVGVERGAAEGLQHCVAALHTPGFPFHADPAIQTSIWKKAIINCVFNTLCPLLETDNGIFIRNPEVTAIAATLVRECMTLVHAKGIPGLTQEAIMDQILTISRGSNGQLISTLQDIRHGRETEMAYLNLEMARVAAEMTPEVELPLTQMLGRMVELKAAESHRD